MLGTDNICDAGVLMMRVLRAEVSQKCIETFRYDYGDRDRTNYVKSFVIPKN